VTTYQFFGEDMDVATNYVPNGLPGAGDTVARGWLSADQKIKTSSNRRVPRRGRKWSTELFGPVADIGKTSTAISNWTASWNA